MMRQTCLAMAAAILVHAPAMAETTAKDVSDTVQAYTVEKKDQALAYGKKVVREADRKIGELEKDAAKAKGEIKAEYQKDIKELRAKRAQAARKLDEMGKASAAAWDDAKTGFADAYKDLHQAYNRAVAKLKK